MSKHSHVAQIRSMPEDLSGSRIAPSLVAEVGHQASAALVAAHRRAKQGGTMLADHAVRVTVEIIRSEEVSRTLEPKR